MEGLPEQKQEKREEINMEGLPEQKQEKREEIKTLKYDQSLVPLILSGEKDVTWRFFDEKNIQEGEKLIFVNKQTGEEFAKAIIISVREKRLGEIEESDFEGHEKFENKDKMIEIYKKYYGDKVDWNSVFKIIKFWLESAETVDNII